MLERFFFGEMNIFYKKLRIFTTQSLILIEFFSHQSRGDFLMTVCG